MVKKTKEPKKDEKKKKSSFPILIIFICIAIPLLVGLIILSFFLYKKYFEVTPKNKDYSALLVVLKPNLSVDRDGKEITDLGEQFNLEQGDKVKTNENGQGYIIFPDNSSVSIDINSEVQIDEVKETDNSFVVHLSQLAGRTWSRVENLFHKGSDYQVQTPNTIAAVRGTQFGCDVIPGDSTCYSIEHDINLTLKNIDSFDNTFALPEGKFYDNDDEQKPASEEEILNKIGDLVIDDEWKTLNECINEKSEKLLGEDNKVIGFLLDNFKEIGCGPVGETPSVTEEPNPTSDPTTPTPSVKVTGAPTVGLTITPSPTPYPKPSIRTVTLSMKGSTMICSWSGANATSYYVSIVTVSGADPTNKTTSTTYTTTSGKPNNYYYCNVKAQGNGGTSSIATSNSLYFETAVASILSTTPADANSTWGGSVSVAGSYSGVTLSNLRAKYYIKRNDSGQYLRSNGIWASGINWIYMTPAAYTGYVNGYKASSTTGGVNGYYNVDIYFVVYHNLSGRTLSTKSLNVPTNYVILY